MKDSILIRPLRHWDVPTLANIVQEAFGGAHAPPRYQAHSIEDRLILSLKFPRFGIPVTLVAELDGEPVALGQYGPARWAAHTWELMLGATRQDLQGQGIGHQLALARLTAIAEAGGGQVVVSTKNQTRWERYGFIKAWRNPNTEAVVMWREISAGKKDGVAA